MDIEIDGYYGYEYGNKNWLYVQVIECDTYFISVIVIRDKDNHQPRWKRGTIHTVGIDSFHRFIKFTEGEIMYEVL